MEDLNIISEQTVEIGMIIASPFGPGIFRVLLGGRRLLVSARPMINPSTINTRAMSENAAMISCKVYCAGEMVG